MSNDKMSCNEVVRQIFTIAKEKNISIRELERRAGLGENVVFCWKNKREPLVGNLLAALQVLGFKLDVVSLEGEDD